MRDPSLRSFDDQLNRLFGRKVCRCGMTGYWKSIYSQQTAECIVDYFLQGECR